ncbi:telomere length regulation protein TEL2 homolog [Ornithodoros turicata]|uniref:telomere length regulation protein TEL2 homolog n=1 Tax=Ornithodoros turicata TaxID=34597 RepID=UPI00313890AC
MYERGGKIMAPETNTANVIEFVRRILSGSAQCHQLDIIENVLECRTALKNEASHDPKVSSSYCHLISALLECLNANSLRTSEEEELFSKLILCGAPEDVLLILTSTLGNTQRSYKQDKIVLLLSQFIENGHVEELLKGFCECKGFSKDASWNELETVLISIPERLANVCGTNVKSSLTSENYYKTIYRSLHLTLLHLCDKIRVGTDVNVTYLSRLLGRLCATGNALCFARVLLPQLVKHAKEDFIFRRLCHTLVTNVPDSSLESVMTAILAHLTCYTQVDWLCGDSVCTSSSLKYIFTMKLPLMRSFEKDDVLKNVIGHLASSERRRPLFQDLLREVLCAWGDKTLMTHQGELQQNYLTRALMISVGHLREHGCPKSDDLVRVLLHGVQNHIASPEEKIRHYGMVVAENLSSVLQPHGPKLKFEYESNPETAHLESLTNISETDSIEPVCGSDVVEIRRQSEESKPTVEYKDLDSDDDLEPYDMSHDTPLANKKPRYLRDCMEGLLEGEKPEWFESCLQSVEELITKCRDELRDVAAELAKILLYLEDKFSTDGFVSSRQRSLVVLTVQCPKKVAEYLTAQFYDRNLNIRQRLDILEVLALASHELSTPVAQKPPQNTSVSRIAEKHWEVVVRERIAAKTRHFSKGRSREETPAKNRFADVAGFFFYPLMRYYDRGQNTFDLLGDDSFVLARLIYTLGIIQSSAVHSPRSCHMARCLLEFVNSLRYHVEAYVREAILFSLSMVFINIPPSVLVSEVWSEMQELQCWLGSVVENDTSETCKMRAAQVLHLLSAVMREQAPALGE